MHFGVRQTAAAISASALIFCCSCEKHHLGEDPEAQKEHVDVAKRALDKLLGFKPNLLLISAGFDAFARDPLVQMTLEQEDFASFGKWLRKIDIPIAAVLEGGYSDDLPELIDAFLTTWSS